MLVACCKEAICPQSGNYEPPWTYGMKAIDLRYENHGLWYENHGLTVWNPWTYDMKTMDLRYGTHGQNSL